MIILKLGGSVITRKDSLTPTLDSNNLTRIAREISNSSHHKLIVVHGAGSFGHPYAKEYAIGSEIKSTQELTRKRTGILKNSKFGQKPECTGMSTSIGTRNPSSINTTIIIHRNT